MHYVDWCDAYAYCKWAKKQLCGRVTGGAADDSTQPNAKCRVRGGSYAAGNDDSVALSCAGERTEQRVPAVPNSGPDPLADIGFRCCVY